MYCEIYLDLGWLNAGVVLIKDAQIIVGKNKFVTVGITTAKIMKDVVVRFNVTYIKRSQ